MSLEGENTSDFEKQNTIGKPMNSTPALEENYVTHEKMMELKPLLEDSGERNLRSINLTNGEIPCHCLAQTVWYPEHSNLCLIWDVEEVRSIGLPYHRQNVTLLVVSSMLALLLVVVVVVVVAVAVVVVVVVIVCGYAEGSS